MKTSFIPTRSGARAHAGDLSPRSSASSAGGVPLSQGGRDLSLAGVQSEPLYDDNSGEPAGYVNIARDISLRKLEEADFQRSLATAEQSGQLRPLDRHCQPPAFRPGDRARMAARRPRTDQPFRLAARCRPLQALQRREWAPDRRSSVCGRWSRRSSRWSAVRPICWRAMAGKNSWWCCRIPTPPAPPDGGMDSRGRRSVQTAASGQSAVWSNYAECRLRHDDSRIPRSLIFICWRRPTRRFTAPNPAGGIVCSWRRHCPVRGRFCDGDATRPPARRQDDISCS